VQFDADTVGAESVAADAEMCMLAADTLEALGIPRGQYVVKVNNRKLLDGLMEASGLAGPEHRARRLVVLRAIDKLDRLGTHGVGLLLGPGRSDESGDFTPGAELSSSVATRILNMVGGGADFWRPVDAFPAPTEDEAVLSAAEIKAQVDPDLPVEAHRSYYPHQEGLLDLWAKSLEGSAVGEAGLAELRALLAIVRSAGYGSRRIQISSSVVRGLEYYTGPVFEAELTFEVKNDDGETVRFGSVGGGGRYDDLVARFTGERVPATGFSIGVSRLAAALRALGQTETQVAEGPVVVLVMDKAELAHYQRLTQTLRQAGIRAEMYLGSSGMKAQMKYADKRGAPCVVIQGSDERAKGEVTIKDLIEGAKAAAAIKDNKEWKEARPAQITVPEAEMVARVREILARHRL
jgi:histidyl-tRNA synthetase